MMNEQLKPLSVRQLNLYVKSLLEGDVRLLDIWVKGEISNFKNHYASGHWYFTVKDADSSLRCVMFKGSNKNVSFAPADGMQVLLRGRVSIFEKDGQYMFYASEMCEFGVGELAIEFNLVKQKLQNEGLFDSENKRALPPFPKRIAVVTSDTGAAVKDITNILNIRYPLCEIVLCPVQVQGVNAAADIINTLKRVYLLKSVDLIILGRGGGSAEDLSAFNNEALARVIYESPVPVVSAVGHETDFSISDFVADVRASTPSHAAELAVPDITELQSRLGYYYNRIFSAHKNRIEREEARFKVLSERFTAKELQGLIDEKSAELDGARDSLLNAFESIFLKKQQEFLSTLSRIDALSPFKVIAKGFSTVRKEGKLVKSIGDIDKGDSVEIGLYDGYAECTVKKTEKEVLFYGKR